MNKLFALLIVVTNLYAAEPDFQTFKPIRTVTSKGILGDVESHLKAGNPYTNGNTQIETSVHEGTHGINSWARGGSTKYNGFYCLNDRYVQLWEPKITLTDVSKNVPLTFKTPSNYNGYAKHIKGSGKRMGEDGWHLSQWETQPLYILDEWMAYTHGVMYYAEIGEINKWTVAPTLLIDQTVFSFALIKSLPEDYAYRQELTDFIRWNTKRVLALTDHSEVMIERWSLFLHSEDCIELKKLYDEVMK